ncbi:hypothetical protein LQG66_09845 [Bradyrhizobium ontarionense]|uniref:Uncharacterized protein n=1 Tax=Bradyrhizobium ontarionense TaxID=2898149 RepID=A0ABY3RI00_9BRAD|nr:hypothetical protein [Bradyrhizobium sp. A19]UFZ06570.1 hypothetical protein LQG66_09845 [Bradyrhizobium sp. A19]
MASQFQDGAKANFNIRGWQGRWRHTAPTTLFFLGPRLIAEAAWNRHGGHGSPAGDLLFTGNSLLNAPPTFGANIR